MRVRRMGAGVVPSTESRAGRSLAAKALLGALPLWAVVLTTGSAHGQEVHRLTSERVSIFNLAGEVDVVRGSGNEVVVEVTRGGDDADRLEVQVGQVRGRESLRVIYPEDRVVYREMRRGSNTTVRVRGDGTFFEGRGGDRVRISGRGSGLEAHADLRVLVPAGADVAIYLAVGEGRASDLEADLRIETGSGEVNVDGVVGAVEVDTGSGGVTISGVRGGVSAETGSGSIDLVDISGSRLTADTGSGHVEGTDVSVDELSIDTGSGHIRIDRLSAVEIICDTGSGSVELGLLTDVDRLMVDTGSGRVTLTVPADFGVRAELDSGSGRVNVDVPSEADESRRTYFRGTIGDGRGRAVIETGSGGIEIRRG